MDYWLTRIGEVKIHLYFFMGTERQGLLRNERTLLASRRFYKN